MFRKRRIESDPAWSDPDGIKIYTVSATGNQVEQQVYAGQLQALKKLKQVSWPSTAAFAIFHDGANDARYLVLAWWGNDNELFTSVSVREDNAWVINADKYSFCLWDLEIMWAERNYYVDTVYRETPDISQYRELRFKSAAD